MGKIRKKSELTGHDAYEFSKGRYREPWEHWREDSLYLMDDDFTKELAEVFWEAVPGVNFYGPTVIERKDWEKLHLAAKGKPYAEAILSELAEFAAECFDTEGAFTMLGI